MTNNSIHIAVLAFPFGTHAHPLLTTVRRLAASEPSLGFSFLTTAKSNAHLFSGLKPQELENIRYYNVWDGLPDGYNFTGNVEEAVEFFVKAMPGNFKKVLKEVEAHTGVKIDCLMTDTFFWFGGEMAEEMGVPWVAFWAGGPFSLSVHIYTDLIRSTLGTSGIAGREDEMLEFIPGFSALRLGDLPSGVLFGNLESPFSIMLHKMGQLLPRATAVLINSFEELDPDHTKDLKTKFQNFLNIGPFNLTSPPPSSNFDEHGCIRWLDNHKTGSVAYIGFGTVAVPPPTELVALAEALEASNTPFLWSLKDHLKKHLPDEFLSRSTEIGKIVPWAPQVQVLAHGSVGVFITHCGWNSVLESIAAGVPMIGRPFFGDHQLNTWMVENVWKIGVRVEGGVFTKTGTIQALDQVLSHEKGKELKQQIIVYKELGLKAVGPNGSSTENFKSLVELITNDNL